MSIVTNSREDLMARRAQILKSLNTSREQFMEAQISRSLTGTEWEAKENLDAIGFLLGEETQD